MLKEVRMLAISLAHAGSGTQCRKLSFRAVYFGFSLFLHAGYDFARFSSAKRAGVIP